MPVLKNEWKTILIAVWLVAITIFMFRLHGQMEQLNARSARLASTLDSVESVVLSTDTGVVQMGKRVGDMESNVDFIVQKVRRR